MPVLTRANGNSARSHSCVEGTEFIVTLADNQAESQLTSLVADLQRIGKEHVLVSEDAEAIQLLRRGRELTIMNLLQSVVSISNKQFASIFSPMIFKHSSKALMSAWP